MGATTSCKPEPASDRTATDDERERGGTEGCVSFFVCFAINGDVGRLGMADGAGVDGRDEEVCEGAFVEEAPVRRSNARPVDI